MGSPIDKQTLRGLIVPTGADLADSSGLYLAGSLVGDLPVAASRPGRPEPESTSQQGILESYPGDGTWVSQDLRVVVARGGHPDRQGAALYLEADGLLYGWEAPSVLYYSKYLSSVGLSDAAICVHPDGLVAAGQAGTAYLRLLQLSADGSSIVTTTNISDQETILTSRTLPYSPALVCLPNNRVVCFFFGEESTGFWSIRSAYSDDQGATWEMLSPRIHPDTYNPGTILPRRIRAAYNQGQILICVEYMQGVANGIAQLVSYDSGATATIIAGLNGSTAGLALGGGHDVAALPGGGFVLAYIGQSDLYPYSYRIASAEEPFAYASTQVQIVGAGDTWGTLSVGYLSTDLDLILVSAEDGTLYLTARLAGGSDAWISLRSLDSGDTWDPMGDTVGLQAGAWHSTTVAGTGPWLAAGCWWKGAIWMIHNSQSAAGFSGADRLWVSALGGARNITLPTLHSGGDEADQITWEKTWLPTDKPQDAGWTRSVAGAPSEAFSSGAFAVTTGAGETVSYTRIPAGSATGLVVESELEVTSGTVKVHAAIDDGVFTYEVRCNVTSTAITAFDEYGASIGTLAVSGRFYLRIQMKAAIAAVWITSDGITWENVCESQALVNGGGAIGTNRVKWSLIASTSANWYRVAYASGSYGGIVAVVDPPEQAGISGGLFIVRDGLHPRPASSSPTFAWDGLALALRAGPVAAGEGWGISNASPFASENCLPSVRASPRSVARWEDQGTTADELRMTINMDASAAAPGILVGCYLLGLFGGPWTLSLYNGSAWVPLATTSVYTFTGRLVAAGNYCVLRPTTVPDIQLRLNELKGAAIQVWTDSGKTTLTGSGRVVSNSEGIVLAWASAGRQARIVVEGLSPDATVRYFEIFPTRAIAILDSADVDVNTVPAQIRLSLPITSPFYGDLLGEIGICAVGPVAIFGKDYSLTRSIAVEPGGKLLDLPGGIRLADDATPTMISMELAWVEGVDLTDIRTADSDATHIPDYVLWTSSSGAVAARHDTALLVADLIEQMNGTGLLVIVPYIPLDSAPAWIDSINRARGTLYGRMVGSSRLEQAVGAEEVSEVMRVSTVTIEGEL